VTTEIRNFCIIAHIDHGKSTLADRLLQRTGAITDREFQNQVLDDMDLERERGITIKASAVRIFYDAKNGKRYLMNLIDTPGHVDFTYEVSKSLRACEGALLVVDASQGVQAQTVTNLYLALDHHIEIIPVLNKIDLASADIKKVSDQLHNLLGASEEILSVSAKMNKGIDDVLEAIVHKVPAPQGKSTETLRALIFDSVFDNYKGVIIYVRVMHGTFAPKAQIKLMSNKRTYEVLEMGILTPKPVKTDSLSAGEVGFIICNIRDPKDIENGDTITTVENSAQEPLAGYRKVRPMVFVGIYPVNTRDLTLLRDTLHKLKLNDPSFAYENESSASFGFGFRCGFLGLLHMEIIQERLEREFNLDLIATAPSVVYEVLKTDDTLQSVDNPANFPEAHHIKEVREPFVDAHVIAPKESMGAILELCEARRGDFISNEFIDPERVRIGYALPLSEILVDFYDVIKSITKGYGSLDYDFKGYRSAPMSKLDVLVNGEICDALSLIVHKENAQTKGRALVHRLKEVIPRQMIDIALQAAVGNRIIARETIKAMRKDVTSKCYGGDITRKRKLWAKQKAGKKRMKQFGKVQIPQEAFIAALRLSDQ
jgi:GTP-binding protein LepA